MLVGLGFFWFPDDPGLRLVSQRVPHKCFFSGLRLLPQESELSLAS